MIARRREEAAPGNGDEAVPAMLASIETSAARQRLKAKRPHKAAFGEFHPFNKIRCEDAICRTSCRDFFFRRREIHAGRLVEIDQRVNRSVNE